MCMKILFFITLRGPQNEKELNYSVFSQKKFIQLPTIDGDRLRHTNISDDDMVTKSKT